MVEKSAEEKARETRLILSEQLKLLEGSETKRLAQARTERERDEARGAARGEEIFGGQALGRISQDPSAKSLQLQKQREASLIEQRAASAKDVAGRESQIKRTTSELDKLIAARTDPNSELAKLHRSAGREQINRALQGQLGQIRAAGNLGQSGVNQALIGDALGGAMQARSGLERDILLQGLQSAEDLTVQKELLREEGTTKKEGLRQSGRAEEAALRSRLENIQGAIQDDTLRRQLINLDQRSKETFGKLGLQENIVAQGVAERSGVRQQVLAETQAAEATRSQQEREELQRKEVEKDPPQAGGKIICGELYRQGLMDGTIYMGDLEYAETLSDEVRDGYLSWARPVVKIMRKSKLFTKLVALVANEWAIEMAYRVKYTEKGSVVGKILSYIGEPICNLIGVTRKLLGFRSLCEKRRRA